MNTSPSPRSVMLTAVAVVVTIALLITLLSEPEAGDTHIFYTLQSAVATAVAVYTIFIDAVIWLTVVIGPFVLFALGLRRLFRHAPAAAAAPTPSETQEEKKP